MSTLTTARGHGSVVPFTAAITVAMAIATAVQFAFGALGPRLLEELGLSRTELGGLTTAFFVSGALCSVIAGALVDRVGTRRVLFALFAVEALAFLVMAGVPTIVGLTVGAVIAGSGSAAGNPVTNRLVMEHLEEGSRGLVMGVKQSGVWVGAVAFGAVLPPVAAAFGLRAAFLAAAAAAVSGLAVAKIGLPTRPPPVDEAGTDHAAAASRRPDWLRWLVPYAFFMGAGASAITTFLAVYAHERVGLSEVRAGTTLAVLGVAGVGGRLAWGWIAERARTLYTPLTVIALLAMASELLLVVAGVVGEWLLWVATAALGATGMAWNVVGMMTIVRVADVSEAGRLSGTVMTGFFVGLLLSPFLLGLLADTTRSYLAGWFVTSALFLAAAVASWSGRTSSSFGS